MTSEVVTILLPAFAAGIIVLSTHVILGFQVLKRGIIFMDLAVAQVAAIGLILFHLFNEFSDLPWSQYWLPIIFSLICGYFISQFEKHNSAELEAIIGCIYVLAATIGMILLAKNPHGAELLKRVLSGNILWVNWSQLILPCIFSLIFILLIRFRPDILSGKMFYLLFAVTITFSLELVGVFLVFSSLIFPALATNRMKVKNRWLFGFLLGVGGYVLGLLFSAKWDLPSGSAIILCLGVCSLLFRISLAKLK